MILCVIILEIFFWYLVIVKEMIFSFLFVKYEYCKFVFLLLVLNVFVFYEIKDFFDFVVVV